tara:strand:- start:2011 stop:2436 length:426 start_codon:yes stop_codon:yes gene_type:complete
MELKMPDNVTYVKIPGVSKVKRAKCARYPVKCDEDATYYLDEGGCPTEIAPEIEFLDGTVAFCSPECELSYRTEGEDQRQVKVLTPYVTYLIEGVEYAAAAGMYGKDHVFIIFREHQKESMVFPAGLAEHLLTECILRGGE